MAFSTDCEGTNSPCAIDDYLRIKAVEGRGCTGILSPPELLGSPEMTARQPITERLAAAA
jgi:hypothetical protein